jgi:nitrilase
MNVFTVAVVQAASVAFDAARKGASRIPRSFRPIRKASTSVPGVRTAEVRDMFRRYFDGAIDVPGPATARNSQIAKANDLHLVVGVIERDGTRSIARRCSSRRQATSRPSTATKYLRSNVC